MTRERSSNGAPIHQAHHEPAPEARLWRGPKPAHRALCAGTETSGTGKMKNPMRCTYETVEYLSHHAALDPDLSGTDFLDGLEEYIGCFLLQDQSHGAKAHGTAMQVGIEHPGQDEHTGAVGSGEQVGNTVKGHIPAQVEVQHNEVGLLPGGHGEGIVAAIGLPYHLKLRMALKQQADPSAHELVVVDKEYTDGLY